MKSIGVLLINLGTPAAPSRAALKKYLLEFLTDPRVIDIPWINRQFLVRGLIIPFRINQSLKSYQAIWTEFGSPLLVHSQKAAHLLQQKLGTGFHVELAMRYQNPSINEALKSLLAKQLDELIILPLFPQYASATTGSIFEKTFKELSPYSRLPKLTFIDQFHSHPSFIQAFKTASDPFPLHSYDHVLFSFHGLPERQLKKSGVSGFCAASECCNTFCSENRFCYAAQCYRTAHLIAESCKLQRSNYTICFQSRLGKEPWIQPFTSETIKTLARNGAKKILVFCPAFVADCLETLFEIAIEYKELFIEEGGETLDLVPSLNASPSWIDALKNIILDKTR